MACINCGSTRLASVYGKTSDLCVVWVGTTEHEGYVPRDMNIGGGDDIQFTYCLDCGRIKATFPLPRTKIEEVDDEVNDD